MLFPFNELDPQAGRCPGGYPFWPAGARAGRSLAWPQSGFTKSECSSADQQACSNRILKGNPSPSAFELRPRRRRSAGRSPHP
jgi:hypothetical protein